MTNKPLDIMKEYKKAERLAFRHIPPDMNLLPVNDAFREFEKLFKRLAKRLTIVD